MITTKQLKQVFGDPFVDRLTFEKNFMVLLLVPEEIRMKIPVLPQKIYINKVAAPKLLAAFREVIRNGVNNEIKTYDGCFVIRRQRQSNVISRHSYGIAIDLNAAWNPLIRGVKAEDHAALRKKHVQWSEKFLDCWRRTGWVCGADWRTSIDGMHFEIKEI